MEPDPHPYWYIRQAWRLGDIPTKLKLEEAFPEVFETISQDFLHPIQNSSRNPMKQLLKLPPCPHPYWHIGQAWQSGEVPTKLKLEEAFPELFRDIEPQWWDSEELENVPPGYYSSSGQEVYFWDGRHFQVVGSDHKWWSSEMDEKLYGPLVFPSE